MEPRQESVSEAYHWAMGVDGDWSPGHPNRIPGWTRPNGRVGLNLLYDVGGLGVRKIRMFVGSGFLGQIWSSWDPLDSRRHMIFPKSAIFFWKRRVLKLTSLQVVRYVIDITSSMF